MLGTQQTDLICRLDLQDLLFSGSLNVSQGRQNILYKVSLRVYTCSTKLKVTAGAEKPECCL